MTIISKSASMAELASCIYDMHKTAMITSNKSYAKASANSFLSNELNSMRTDEFSYKNSQIKNWKAKNNFMQPISETLGRVGGYLKGFFTAGTKYIPNLLACGVALFAKNKTIANSAAALIGILEGWNFIKNTTGVKQRNDYLKM